MSEFDTKAQQRIVDHDASEAERTYAMWMHLSLLGYFIASVLMIIVPIVMWLHKKDESPFIDDHGRETLNFHITLILYSLFLPIPAAIIGILFCGVGVVIFPLIAVALPWVLGAIGMIQAAMAAKRGEYYRYPMTLRLL